MDSFDVDRYFNLLRMKSYEFKPKFQPKPEQQRTCFTINTHIDKVQENAPIKLQVSVRVKDEESLDEVI